LSAEILDFVRRAEAAKPVPAGEQPGPIAGSTVADIAATLDFDDRGDFIVDTATAWPVSVRHLRRISSGEGSRVDTVELTRLSA
jgi:hypothetical protein